jgi:hypothetical protein
LVWQSFDVFNSQATKLEIYLNCIGTLCAIAAGSAQVPLRSLLASEAF